MSISTHYNLEMVCGSVLYIMPHIFNGHSLNFTTPYGVWFYIQTDVCISSKGEKKDVYMSTDQVATLSKGSVGICC